MRRDSPSVLIASQQPDTCGAIVSHHLSTVFSTSEAAAGYSAEQFARALSSAAAQAGLTPVGQLGVELSPHGASAVVVLTESHVALHHWPEYSKVTVDIHLCNFRRDNLSRARVLAQLIQNELARFRQRTIWHYQCLSG
jgi:S-adenosylmethionine decarboxylase